MIIWRPMIAGDLDQVLEIANVLHPNYPERIEIFADKLAFDPEGCKIAETSASDMVGYVFSHLWQKGLPPLLDCELGRAPAHADCLHLHDIALLPKARGQGGPEGFLDLMENLARKRRLVWLTLVAIKGQAAYWQAKGFSPVRPDSLLQDRLDSYGDGVTYMVKTIP
ncbi:MAG: GNAT family N-acetyltransferase [Magnetospirillum sp.]